MFSPVRPINYNSPLFTTNVTNADRAVDEMEGMIVTNNNKPRITDKIVKLNIDLDQEMRMFKSTSFKSLGSTMRSRAGQVPLTQLMSAKSLKSTFKKGEYVKSIETIDKQIYEK